MTDRRDFACDRVDRDGSVKRLSILGSTGSIGVTTLDLVARFPERFAVQALAAGSRADRLAEQARRFRPSVVALASEGAAREFRDRFPDFEGEVLCGNEGLVLAATANGTDLVVSALVGAAGLLPTLEALRQGIPVALANKEVLVVAGSLVTRTARARGVALLPLDSEHNALFQAMSGEPRDRVRRLILTASGGPFLRTPKADLAHVTVEQALRHPTWKMGAKITIDSATLMNKGLEVIEAHWLFGFEPGDIDVLIHPQSIVHSLVEYRDGSVLAQLAIPDMAIPIAYALAYPDRLSLSHLPRLRLEEVGQLEFFAPDLDRFPCLRLAYEALRLGGTAPAVLNAANEELVAAFLASRLPFLQIAAGIERILERHQVGSADSLDGLLEADRWAREEARSYIAQRA